VSDAEGTDHHGGSIPTPEARRTDLLMVTSDRSGGLNQDLMYHDVKHRAEKKQTRLKNKERD
jgi:hypothetical protein